VEFRVGGRPVGPGNPTYVIAEVGVNHDGSVADALRLVDVAADAVADAVKFQTFDPAALVSEAAPLANYQAERSAAASQLEMLEALVLPPAELRQIQERCAERGIAFLSTPFDELSARTLLDLDVPAFKVGSGDLTNLPLLTALARAGLPMIVSTGMATMDEVADAVRAIQDAGDPPIALLHCVSSYPTPPDRANLRAMDALASAFPDAVIGYSDHCLGLEVSLAAVARGAAVLERHITLDRTRSGPDHALSLEPDELAALVAGVRTVESSLGDGDKRPVDVELNTRDVARRSLVAARDLPEGHVLRELDIAIKRPGGGLPPGDAAKVIGATLRRAIGHDEPLRQDDLS
jgi:N,N'-diacetyllegionaminate synthase